MTTSSSVALTGRQEPRVCTRPEWSDGSAAEECLDLARSVELHLLPWQEFAIRVILARAPVEHGRMLWAALEAAILVARQNGKGEILLALELYWLFLMRERLIIHTAHEFKTAQEAFIRLKGVIDNYDWLRARVSRERTSHGEEGYALLPKFGGGRLRFLARSRSSGRGFTGDKLIFDEAQELSALTVDAAMPALSARHDPQIVSAGTVPGPRNDSSYWTRLMRRGRRVTPNPGEVLDPGGLAWMEWNIGESHPDYDDPAALAAGNPSLGVLITERFARAERGSLSHAGFGRERLNLWSMAPVTMVIPEDVWLALVDDGSQMVGRFAFGVECPPDLSSAVIAAAGRRADGAWHVEVVEQHDGTAWLPARLAELTRQNEDIAAVVMDPGSPAGALIEDVETEGVTVQTVSTREHAQACGMLYSRATEEDERGDLALRLRHLGDPVLLDALRVATKRPGPQGTWLWNRVESGADISPLVAVTLAGFGLASLPEEEDPWGFWS